MDAERFRELVLALPNVEETRQWGDNLVYWVGDKAIGGKMFALLDLDGRVLDNGRPAPILSFCAGPERFHALLENEDIVPAPYLARAHWVAITRWSALSDAAFAELLRDARALTFAKLTRKTSALLAGPKTAYRKAVVEARAAGKPGAKKKR